MSDSGCQISFFYTKPQLDLEYKELNMVVKYPFSTPNHNVGNFFKNAGGVVKYPFSTPNHNVGDITLTDSQVVKYPFSTPNHNPYSSYIYNLGVVKYPFSTPNHNDGNDTGIKEQLSNILFLHQTSTF